MTTVPDTAGTPAPTAARPAPATTLSVVVCAYTFERWDDVTAAIDSLRRQTHRPEQLLLVSDHNDELLARARTAFPDVTCLASTGAQGLSGARNTGVAAATGDVVAFLDDDAAADPDWAAQLLDAYRDDDVIGVGGAVLPAWRAPRPRWFPEEFLWVVGCSYAGLPTGRSTIRNPIGANMSFRRDVFTAAGGFDATMGRLGKDAAGCEETEFSIRAARGHAGSRILLEPGARCRHTVSAERVTRGYFRRRCRAEGRSKALVSGLAGQSSALESERAYVRRTLPRGVLRGLRDVSRGDLAGAARIGMIVEGVTLTGAAYLTMRLRMALRRRAALG
ncbi:glycosyltransferase family 2 protein [Modestobacter roseus]|uniref:GT2 family glycosyltransferase n=1 Tax=Modestobacter roseus TaxID=1181884 RepID=A0A562IXN5_9ACTN|nr:glycosyltransferase family 2 protein [Modestobacter roseus]TWH75334.1 GT2 family glycosyltransferase [Modestobacter roseus]